MSSSGSVFAERRRGDGASAPVDARRHKDGVEATSASSASASSQALRRGTKRQRVPSSRTGPWPAPSAFRRLQDLSQAHVQSYNYMLDAGLAAAVADIPVREVTVASGDTMQFWLESAEIGWPTRADAKDPLVARSDTRLMPAECRERGLTYAAPMSASLCRRVNGGPVERVSVRMGEVPIMVRSSRCHLHSFGPADLVRAGEEGVEFGGYFICNGIERIVRMLQIPRRNHPMAIHRSAYTNRGPLYSDKGVVMRSVREADNSGVSVTLHYLTDGSATLRFAVNRQEFFLPVILVLKALVACTDKEIYERVLAGDAANTYLSDRILLLLRDAKRYESAIHSREAALSYLGARFRGILEAMPPSLTDAQAGQALLDRYVLVHLPGGAGATRDKFNLLILMLRKLYLFVRGDVLEDSPDSLANQELLLTGHLALMFLKEKLGEFLGGIEEQIKREDAIAARQARAAAAAAAGAAGGAPSRVGGGLGSVLPPALHDGLYFRKVVDRQAPIGKKLYYLLATGNLVTQTGLDLMQVSGYSVVADKINFMRFTTHFRSVHRGQFFAEQKTTTVRKLLPENWGFLCPVHTPDGGPCGLLNHLSSPATVVAHPLSEAAYAEAAEAVQRAAASLERRHSKAGAKSAAAALADGDSEGSGAALAPPVMPSSSTHLPTALHAFLLANGMTPHAALNTVLPSDQLPIMLNGRLLGGAPPHTTYAIAAALRRQKALSTGLAAGVERMASAAAAAAAAGGDDPSSIYGEGGKVPGQTEAIHELVRSAVAGRTRVDVLGLACVADASPDAAAGGDAVASGGGKSTGPGGAAITSGAREAAGAAGIALPALPLPSIVLPASMEVAFIPPPWWDAETDPATAAALAAGGAAGAAAAGGGAGGKGPAEGREKLVGLFPGLFLSTAQARLIRPVLQLDTGLVELLSPLEQPYLDIACTPEDVEDILSQSLEEAAADALALEHPDGAEEADSSTAVALPAARSSRCLYTHIELSPVAMLSEAAQLTPFSDLNQSPRNMYQCQMGKQTMGTPLHSWGRRTDTKLFRLQNPQAPLVQTGAQGEWGMDEYPNGCNAVVAVIAYTGYDMEDAFILNKASYERGFGHASVYKVYKFDLTEHKGAADAGRFLFHNTYVKGEQPYKLGAAPGADGAAAPAKGPDGEPLRPRVGDRIAPNLDEDGLPPVGTLLRYGDPIYAVLDTTTGTHKLARHKEVEPAYVDEVRILGMGAGTGHSSAAAATPGVQNVSVKLRFNRNPVVGDKFSSRHGQKGVLSFLWPQQDMPFSESGMSPDVIINPHAFPSRMTIGMLVESMAGKAGALHGHFQDATPFRFDERHRVADYFGEQLRSAGYAYYGTEALHSGVTGEPLHCDIYLGVVYYQRLRHMVSDKSQARATGPINQLTRQPVKGRKKHGGIRFGEMERDSLLAHGASFLLHDRLHNSSDRHLALVCRACGSMLSTYSLPAAASVLSLPDDPDAPLTATGPMVPVQTTAGGGVTTTLLNFSASSGGGAGGAAAPAGAVPVVNRTQRVPMCRNCGSGKDVVPVPMPYVLRYLANELAAMNIKIELALGAGPYGPQ